MSEQIGGLVRAIREIGKVRATLEVTKKTCECCGKAAYDDWEEFQVYEALGACITRLHKAVKFFKKN